jgi:hypothetical protein
VIGMRSDHQKSGDGHAGVLVRQGAVVLGPPGEAAKQVREHARCVCAKPGRRKACGLSELLRPP